MGSTLRNSLEDNVTIPLYLWKKMTVRNSEDGTSNPYHALTEIESCVLSAVKTSGERLRWDGLCSVCVVADND